MRFVVSLGPFWQGGDAVEGLRYASTLLDRTEPPPRTARWAAALESIADLHIALGQYPAAGRLLDEALTIAESGDDYELVNLILYDLGFVAAQLGQLDKARACYDRCLSQAREHHDERGELFGIKGLADVLCEEGDERARTYYEQALGIARTRNDLRTMAVIYGNQATDEYKRGNLDAAEQLANEALTLSRKIHYSGLGTTATVNLAGLAIRRLTPSTDPARRVELLNLAKAYCLDALGIARRTYDVESQACALLNAARTAYHADDPLRAVRLRGTSDAKADEIQLVWNEVLRDERETQLAALHEIIDRTDFDAAYQRGRSLSLAEAIAVVEEIKI